MKFGRAPAMMSTSTRVSPVLTAEPPRFRLPRALLRTFPSAVWATGSARRMRLHEGTRASRLSLVLAPEVHLNESRASQSRQGVGSCRVGALGRPRIPPGAPWETLCCRWRNSGPCPGAVCEFQRHADSVARCAFMARALMRHDSAHRPRSRSRSTKWQPSPTIRPPPTLAVLGPVLAGIAPALTVITNVFGPGVAARSCPDATHLRRKAAVEADHQQLGHLRGAAAVSMRSSSSSVSAERLLDEHMLAGRMSAQARSRCMRVVTRADDHCIDLRGRSSSASVSVVASAKPNLRAGVHAARRRRRTRCVRRRAPAGLECRDQHRAWRSCRRR